MENQDQEQLQEQVEIPQEKKTKRIGREKNGIFWIFRRASKDAIEIRNSQQEAVHNVNFALPATLVKSL